MSIGTSELQVWHRYCHSPSGASQQSPHPPQPSSLRLPCARPQDNPAWSQGIRARSLGGIELLSTDSVLLERPLEEIAQHYTQPRFVLTNVVLNPSLPVAA
jgi:hypothetical protein